MTCDLKYVLITPAKNEEAFIELTVQSVIGQTVLPIKWVIVSDGSTDGTEGIVEKYVNKYHWIELVKMPERSERHFAGKVYAFNEGYRIVKILDYDIIASLDADISFGEDYFESLLKRFEEDVRLGVAGYPFREGNVQYDYRFSRKEHVSGACQLLRRECFESIGGYMPLEAGAIDLTAVVTARMKGWKTRTFTDKHCIHHRRMGTAKTNVLIASFKSGYGDFPMGVHPLWQFSRSIYQMSRKPFILGGLMLLMGYVWAMMTAARTPVSKEFVQFRRNEQLNWLKEYIYKTIGLYKKVSF